MKDDTYTFLNALKNNNTKETLRETMTNLFGEEKGNQYVQEIIQHIWKADNWNTSSKLFMHAQQNWLTSESINTQRPKIENILQTIYDYQWFENYQKLIDKQRIMTNFDKIINNEITNDNFDTIYTAEQKAILSHTAFIYINESDLYDLFFEEWTKETVGKFIQEEISASEPITWNSKITNTWDNNANLWNISSSNSLETIPLWKEKNRLSPNISIEIEN